MDGTQALLLYILVSLLIGIVVCLITLTVVWLCVTAWSGAVGLVIGWIPAVLVAILVGVIAILLWPLMLVGALFGGLELLVEHGVPWLQKRWKLRA